MLSLPERTDTGHQQMVLYALAVITLVVAGRRGDERVLAGFIPVAGQLDDAIIVAIVLRAILRSAGDEVLREHWPGPERSLNVIRALA